MILDSLVVGRLAAELSVRYSGLHIRRAGVTDSALIVHIEGGGTTDALQMRFGPPASLRLGLTPGHVTGGQGREKYLAGARIDGIEAEPGDRILRWRLSRPDAAGQRTHGILHMQLIPPRFRAALSSVSHGRLLGSWAASDDRKAPQIGESYQPPGAARNTGQIDPRTAQAAALHEALHTEPPPLDKALRRILAGADRHLALRVLAEAQISQETTPAELTEEEITRLTDAAAAIWSGSSIYRWADPQVRLSIAAPRTELAASRFDNVFEALCVDDAEEHASQTNDPTPPVRRALRILRRREAGLQEDFAQIDDADRLERIGHSLMAAPDAVAPGDSGSIADAHDETGQARFDIQLGRGETAAQHATQLLRRAAKLRRRAEALPSRLHRVRELIFDTENLLRRLESGEHPTETEMERWERRVEVRPAPSRDAQAAGVRDDRHGARPRRYRTSAGWSVWAGRNNQENDIVTHKLAAQNDTWFHAHGYAGSHVILRREGRNDEPDRKSLEEAAAVAAYWSKGRTANKVPVAYTLAKFVSKPKGGAAGLAVMKREKTMMVRPALLPEEGETS